MNLYAIVPSFAPGNEVQLVLAESDEEAMKEGIYVAARDIVRGNYFSPTADVYRIGPATKIGEAEAADVPAHEWAKDVPAEVRRIRDELECFGIEAASRE